MTYPVPLNPFHSMRKIKPDRNFHPSFAHWTRHVVAMIFLTASIPAAAQGLTISESGNPSYHHAIAIPPGIAGMEPKLGLVHVAGSNGVVGYGWGLEGTSSISRCSHKKSVDSMVRSVVFNSDDKLCLDGQRLIQTDANGTMIAFPQTGDSLGLSSGYREYRTEKDSFARIRAYGQVDGVAAKGPNHIKVWTKNGLIYEYGNNTNATANSAVRNQKGVVAVWAISRITDAFGNYIDFQYDQRDVAWGSGPSGATPGREWSVVEIRYTGTPSQPPANKIIFDYVDRSSVPGQPQDSSEAYANGGKVVKVRLLRALRTYINSPNATTLGPSANAVKVKTLKLLYDKGPVTGRSRLKRITECGGAIEDKCLPSTTFDYTAGGSETFTASSTFSNSALSTLPMQSSFATVDGMAGDYGLIAVDFNGDGKTDILRWTENALENQLWTSNGDGGFTKETAFNVSDILFKRDGCYSTVVIDANGDGLPDLLRYSGPLDASGINSCSSYGSTYIFYNNGNGAFTKKSYAGPNLKRYISNYLTQCVEAGGAGSGWNCTTPAGSDFILTDFNGDGKFDIIITLLPSYTYYSTSDAWFGKPPDQPVADPCLQMVCTTVWRGNGDGTFTQVSTNLANRSIYTGSLLRDVRNWSTDMDGDGLADLDGIAVAEPGGFILNTYPGYRSRGDGNFDPVNKAAGCSNLDFNGDGKADCLTAYNPSAYNTLSVGSGDGQYTTVSAFNLKGAGQELSGDHAGMVEADLNGDGKSDILRWHNDSTRNAVYLSNGDGMFRESATFNLKTASDKLRSTDGANSFLLGDFTGRGGVEILRLTRGPSSASNASRNRLYVKDAVPPDLLLAAVSGTGMVTKLTYVPLGNSISGTLGARYTSDRGTANAAVYPKVDVVAPLYVVATSEVFGGQQPAITTEYSYLGLKAKFNEDGGLLGFRESRRQGPGADGSSLTVVSQYLLDAPYRGMTSLSESRLGTLAATNTQVLGRARHIYCDTGVNAGVADATLAAAGFTMKAGFHCALSASQKIQRVFLLQSRTETWDLNGTPLPTITATSSYNNTGDPIKIVSEVEGTALGISQLTTKTTENIYFPNNTAGDNWILGRLQKATQQNTVSNSLPNIATSAGNAPNATANKGTGPAVP